MERKQITGRAWVYGDNIDTDRLFPGRYLDLTEANEMAPHALEDLDPSFVKHVRKDDFIVAGKNFGGGSSREQAAIVLRENGIAAVIAKSFARIFYRNAINIGLPPIVAPKIVTITQQLDTISLDLEKGILENLTQTQKETFPQFPHQIQQILVKGGLVPYIRDKIRQ
jgi:3-isopropylmalate/(R)-2-methylmalate dehydratase small subunit